MDRESVLHLPAERYEGEERREREEDRRAPEPEPSNGSIQWKGIRLPFLLGMALTAGGGTAAYSLKAKEPQADLAPRVIVLESEVAYIKKGMDGMNSKLQFLVEAEARRQGREENNR